MVNIGKKLGNKICEARKRLDITQEELADRSGLDYSYVNQIENGRRNPSMEAVEKIAKALKLKVKDLIDF